MPEESSWLLRLFRSEFFDSRLAVYYLHRYPDSVGIQHYICSQLRKFPIEDIEFLLPQLCHLMLSRPLESSSIEEMVLSLCESDVHIALLTLWFLKAYYHDLKYTPNHASFLLCKRLYSRCQSIIFSAESPLNSTDNVSQSRQDPTSLSPSTAPLSSKKSNRQPIQYHAASTLVGMGAILGAMGTPMLAKAGKDLILSQGRKRSIFHSLESIVKTPASPLPEEKQSFLSTQKQLHSHQRASVGPVPSTSSSKQLPEEGMRRSQSISSIKVLANLSTHSPSLEDLRKGSAFSFNGYVAKAVSAFGSHPSVAKSESQPGTLSPQGDGHHLENGSVQNLRHSHYVYSELQFITALVDIGNRLRSVPKPARQSSLIAELTLLNHNLPANVCIPMWCPGKGKKLHHKVLRISPTDAVILNSADRVPYLIMVEVADYNDKEEQVAQAPSPMTIQTLALSSLSLNSPSPTSPTAKEYHKQVVNRRNSAAAMAAMPPQIKNQQEEFAEKMRTAAVMLAQLYQQQQKELASLTATHPPATRGGVAMNSRTCSNLSRSGESSSSLPELSKSSTPPPGSPVLAGRDRRKYQKLKNEFEVIRNRLIKEMSALEEKRVKAQTNKDRSSGDYLVQTNDEILDVDQETLMHKEALKHLKDDPSATAFQENWSAKEKRIKANSSFGDMPNWSLFSVIVKSGADLRQEQLALQLICEMSKIWMESAVPVWVYYYRVLITSNESGLIETVKDAISIHSVKKEGYAKRLNQTGVAFTLYDYFLQQFGDPSSESFLSAQDCFMKSLAGYSLVSYLLQVKDRHNGNILVDTQGHLIHIDFGFMLSNSPGSVGFELAPFKMPQEYIDILGGLYSAKFAEFRALIKTAFIALRKQSDRLVGLVEMMEKDSKLPCFTGTTAKPSTTTETTQLPDSDSEDGPMVASTLPSASYPPPPSVGGPPTTYPVSAAFRERFHLSLPESQLSETVDRLIDSSCNSMFTKLYDSFQYYAQSVF